MLKATLKAGGLLFLMALSHGCSSVAWKEQSAPELPRSVHLQVPFFPQTDYHCGPAALAAIFHYQSVPASPEQIADWIYLPQRKGSLQIEITAAIRRQELLAYPLDGTLNAILTEVAAGNPVLVLQNLSFSWWPQWHYATVVGYNLDQGELLLHSGRIANYRLVFSTFQQTWQRAGNWSLLPLPSTRLPASAEQSRYLKAAADLENSGHPRAAAQAYLSATQQWPQTALAWMGLGNSRYKLGQFDSAAIAYNHLRQLQPDNAFAWNNLAYALLAANCPQQSSRAIDVALTLANDDQRIRKSHDEIIQKIRLLNERDQQSVCSLEDLRILFPAEDHPR